MKSKLAIFSLILSAVGLLLGASILLMFAGILKISSFFWLIYLIIVPFFLMPLLAVTSIICSIISIVIIKIKKNKQLTGIWISILSIILAILDILLAVAIRATMIGANGGSIL